jgi:hypothetical protein
LNWEVVEGEAVLTVDEVVEPIVEVMESAGKV